MKGLKITALAVLAAFAVGLFGWATIAGARMGDIMGVIARKGDAAIEVQDQLGIKRRLTVTRVVAPRESWVVVHLDDDGMPGKRIGVARVKAGESRDIEVRLESVGLTEKLLVAVHIDRGEVGAFEFDMDDKENSPDKPYFVDGKEVATKVKVGEFGVKAEAGEAAIDVANQPGVTESLTIRRTLAPTGAWIVVHLDDKGMPGKRVGLRQMPAGENLDVNITLDRSVKLTDKLLVAVHADRGKPGVFEFDMEDKLGSPDQPFFVNGMEVATAARVR